MTSVSRKWRQLCKQQKLSVRFGKKPKYILSHLKDASLPTASAKPIDIMHSSIDIMWIRFECVAQNEKEQNRNQFSYKIIKKRRTDFVFRNPVISTWIAFYTQIDADILNKWSRVITKWNRLYDATYRTQ